MMKYSDVETLFDVKYALKYVVNDIDAFGCSFLGAFNNYNNDWWNGVLTSKERNKVLEAYRKHLDRERVDALTDKNEAKFQYIMECIEEIEDL